MRYFLFFALLAGSTAMHAQAGLPEMNAERLRINRTGFLVLSSWSVANIVSGAIGTGATSGEARYFHRMNLIWGSVNLLIALPGYLNARKNAGELSLEGSIKAQAAIEKTFLFNAGLDLGYIGAGAWCLEKGNNSSNPSKYKGFGKSILLQGGGLLLFDAIMFATHNHHGKRLYKILGGVIAGPSTLGLKVSI